MVCVCPLGALDATYGSPSLHGEPLVRIPKPVYASSMRRWVTSAWQELWTEIPAVWIWLAVCIAIPWVFGNAFWQPATWLAALVFVPLGVVLYAITWGKPR